MTPADVPRVAVNAFTGPPVPPPLTRILRNALGTTLGHAVELSNDPRFLTGIVPSANVVTTAEELSAFYQCLLDGRRARAACACSSRARCATPPPSRTTGSSTSRSACRSATGSASCWAARPPASTGSTTRTPSAISGFSNVIAWADPERDLAVALLNNGKPILSTHVVRLAELMIAISRGMPKAKTRRRRQPASVVSSLR